MWDGCATLAVLTSAFPEDEQMTLATLHSHPQNLYTDNLHFSGLTICCHTIFTDTMFTWAIQADAHIILSKQFPLVHTYPHLTLRIRTKSTASTHIHAPDTSSNRRTLFHSPEWLHSLWFNGHFVGCNSILSHPLVPTGEITGSRLIHKTQRTTLESLLQFELSNHNGRMRLPFFLWCMCVCVGECVHGG